MSTGNSNGSTGRCDSRCYDAENPECTCCCGGRNHGVGYAQAVQNIKDYAGEMIEDWRELHPEDGYIIEPYLF